jgi:hypothetical protein
MLLSPPATSLNPVGDVSEDGIVVAAAKLLAPAARVRSLIVFEVVHPTVVVPSGWIAIAGLADEPGERAVALDHEPPESVLVEK